MNFGYHFGSFSVVHTISRKTEGRSRDVRIQNVRLEVLLGRVDQVLPQVRIVGPLRKVFERVVRGGLLLVRLRLLEELLLWS